MLHYGAELKGADLASGISEGKLPAARPAVALAVACAVILLPGSRREVRRSCHVEENARPDPPPIKRQSENRLRPFEK